MPTSASTCSTGVGVCHNNVVTTTSLLYLSDAVAGSTNMDVLAAYPTTGATHYLVLNPDVCNNGRAHSKFGEGYLKVDILFARFLRGGWRLLRSTKHFFEQVTKASVKAGPEGVATLSVEGAGRSQIILLSFSWIRKS